MYLLIRARTHLLLAVAVAVLSAPVLAAASHASEAAGEGHSAYKKKKFREAASYFELAITYSPTHAEYYYWASLSHSGAMEDQDAYEWILGALSLSDDDARYHTQHARVCQYLGNPGEAVMAFEKAIARGASDGKLYADYGMVLKQSGHPYQAMEAYRKALSLNSDQPGVAFDLGQSLMELQDPHQAVSAFRQAVATDPRCVDCHLDLGDALLGTGNASAALAAYADVLRLSPEDYRARQRSIQACYALSDFDAARPHVQALQALYDVDKVYALGGMQAYVVDVFQVRDLTVKAYEYYAGQAPEGVQWTFLAFDPTGWQEREFAVRDAVAVASAGKRATRKSGVELVDIREGQAPELLTGWTQKVSYPTVRTTVIDWLKVE